MSEWLRQKGLEKLCKIFQNYYKLGVLCDQCDDEYVDGTAHVLKACRSFVCHLLF